MELWAVFECDVAAGFASRKNRLEKITSDMEYGFGRGNADVKTFTPVHLNPFLKLGHYSVEGPARNISACDRAVYLTPETTEFCHDLTFGLNSSILDTYISDPPCMRADTALSYFSSPKRLDCYRLEASFVVQTGKPLTLRDVLAETWTDDRWTNKTKSVKIYDDYDFSYQDEHWNLEPEHQCDERDKNDEILALASLAEVIRRLKVKHGCEFVFKPEHTVIRLDSNVDTELGPFPLVPTEVERQDVVAHDENAYAALMTAIEVA